MAKPPTPRDLVRQSIRNDPGFKAMMWPDQIFLGNINIPIVKNVPFEVIVLKGKLYAKFTILPVKGGYQSKELVMSFSQFSHMTIKCVEKDGQTTDTDPSAIIFRLTNAASQKVMHSIGESVDKTLRDRGGHGSTYEFLRTTLIMFVRDDPKKEDTEVAMQCTVTGQEGQRVFEFDNKETFDIWQKDLAPKWRSTMSDKWLSTFFNNNRTYDLVGKISGMDFSSLTQAMGLNPRIVDGDRKYFYFNKPVKGINKMLRETNTAKPLAQYFNPNILKRRADEEIGSELEGGFEAAKRPRHGPLCTLHLFNHHQHHHLPFDTRKYYSIVCLDDRHVSVKYEANSEKSELEDCCCREKYEKQTQRFGQASQWDSCEEIDVENEQIVGQVPEVSPSVEEEPEVAQIIGKVPEVAQIVGKVPEVAQIVGKVPEDTQMAGMVPEVTPSSGEVPESSQIVREEPENTLMAGKVPEDSQTIGEEPEVTQIVGDVPEVSQIIGEEPEVTQIVGKVPEVTQIVGDVPEVSQIIGEVPEVTPSSGEVPEDTMIAGKVPEIIQTIEKEPESSQVIGKVPEITKTIGEEREIIRTIEKEPENSQVIGKVPEVYPYFGEVPNVTLTSGEVPEDNQIVGKVPEDTQITGNVPGVTPSSEKEPEVTLTSGEVPENTQIIEEEPNFTPFSLEVPQGAPNSEAAPNFDENLTVSLTSEPNSYTEAPISGDIPQDAENSPNFGENAQFATIFEEKPEICEEKPIFDVIEPPQAFQNVEIEEKPEIVAPPGNFEAETTYAQFDPSIFEEKPQFTPISEVVTTEKALEFDPNSEEKPEISTSQAQYAEDFEEKPNFGTAPQQQIENPPISGDHLENQQISPEMPQFPDVYGDYYGNWPCAQGYSENWNSFETHKPLDMYENREITEKQREMCGMSPPKMTGEIKVGSYQMDEEEEQKPMILNREQRDELVRQNEKRMKKDEEEKARNEMYQGYHVPQNQQFMGGACLPSSSSSLPPVPIPIPMQSPSQIANLLFSPTDGDDYGVYKEFFVNPAPQPTFAMPNSMHDSFSDPQQIQSHVTYPGFHNHYSFPITPQNNQGPLSVMQKLKLSSTPGMKVTVAKRVVVRKTPVTQQQASEAVHLSDDDAPQASNVEPKIDENFEEKEHVTDETQLMAAKHLKYDSVVIIVKDMHTLARQEFVNDNIINFIIDYLMNCRMKKELRDNLYVYVTFFYSRLVANVNTAQISAKNEEMKKLETNINYLSRWTLKKFDIFAKNYLIVPINEEYHWLVAFIVNPAGAIVEVENEEESRKKPKCYIVFLDPLTGLDPRRQTNMSNCLKYYLRGLYNKSKTPNAKFATPTATIFDMSRIEVFRPKNMPVQSNYYDCGLYVLYYIEAFFCGIRPFGVEDMPGFDWLDHYEKGEDMCDLMRDKVYNIMTRLMTPKNRSRLEQHERAKRHGLSTEGARLNRRHSAAWPRTKPRNDAYHLRHYSLSPQRNNMQDNSLFNNPRELAKMWVTRRARQLCLPEEKFASMY